MKDVTLHIIAKDEVKRVEQILCNYRDYFKYVDIAVDDKLADFKRLGKQYNANIYHYTDRNSFGSINFDDKRNFLVDKCKTRWYFRLDTDDEIINPDAIDSVIDNMEKSGIEILCCYYDYSRDEWGNTNAAHYRETIIENTAELYWNKHIHECVLPTIHRGVAIVRDDSIKINHNIDSEHSKKSVHRNLQYLLAEYEEEGEETDPRTLAYLGRSYMGLGKFKDAIIFLEKHINRSGWDEDRYLSWCQLSHIYRIIGMDSRSIACAFEAISELPDRPDAYFELHDCYVNKEDWKKSIEWALMGFSKQLPKTNMLIDPSSYTWRPMLSLAACYFQLGEFTKAKKLFDKAKSYVPTLDYIKETEKVYHDAYYHSEYIDKLMWMTKFLEDRDEDKLVDLIKSVPDELDEHEVVAKLRYEILPPREWGENEVAIFCGSTPNEWSPLSTKDGIGGSEEAVIYLSRELTKLGKKVTVFCNCGNEQGEYDGITYRNIVHFNPRDKYNILISWRANIFMYKIQARNKIVWMHDLPWNILDDEDFHKTYDKIVMLSEYHASLLPESVPKDKIYISSNGIVPEHFDVIKGVPRDPHRIIYASSYNRGLEKILQLWPNIKSEIPDATLHIFYGWDMYDAYMKKGIVKDDGFKARMVELMKQDGVYEHGKIGHEQLLEEYAKSGVWAYPCTYAGEINCIALTKAVACGCACITNDFAVMSERNPQVCVPDEEFESALIGVLNGVIEPPKADINQYISDNSWESIARDWIDNLFPEQMPTKVCQRWEFVQSFIEPDDMIVDIGCNKGDMFKKWDRSVVVSVDVDKYDLPNFVQANAHDLPFDDKEFNVAVLAEILEHTTDPVSMLEEAKRVSETLIITVPYEYDWDTALNPFNTVEKERKRRGSQMDEAMRNANLALEFHDDNYDHLFHKQFYTPELLAEHLEKAGYTDYKIFKLRWQAFSWLGAVAYESGDDSQVVLLDEPVGAGTQTV